LAGRPASLDQVVQMLAIVVWEVAITQQTQQPAPQRQAELCGGGERFGDRQAEVWDGQAGDIGVQQAAGVRMGKSLEGDFVDELDHLVGTRAYCIGHTLGLQRPTPEVPRRSKRARCTILGARETSDRDVAEISFLLSAV
jgi:hypothetical protein